MVTACCCRRWAPSRWPPFIWKGRGRNADYRVLSRQPFRLGDDQGGVWDLFGNGVDGTEASLPVVDGYFTEWYEWVSSYPDCEIAGDPEAEAEEAG